MQFLTMKTASNGEERRLLDLFRALAEPDRMNLMAFAEFLASRCEEPPASAAEPLSTAEPLGLTRPDEESVIGAIKRLSKSYYMLDSTKMLEETSTLMSAHVLKGREAVDVIDELEALFQRHFTDYRADQENP